MKDHTSPIWRIPELDLQHTTLSVSGKMTVDEKIQSNLHRSCLITCKLKHCEHVYFYFDKITSGIEEAKQSPSVSWPDLLWIITHLLANYSDATGMKTQPILTTNIRHPQLWDLRHSVCWGNSSIANNYRRKCSNKTRLTSVGYRNTSNLHWACTNSACHRGADWSQSKA